MIIELRNLDEALGLSYAVELGVNDKFSDRDKYNTEIDSSND